MSSNTWWSTGQLPSSSDQARAMCVYSYRNLCQELWGGRGADGETKKRGKEREGERSRKEVVCKCGWSGSLTDPRLCGDRPPGSWGILCLWLQKGRVRADLPGQHPILLRTPRAWESSFDLQCLSHRSLSCVVGIQAPGRRQGQGKGYRVGLQGTQGAEEDQVLSWIAPHNPLTWVKSSSNPKLRSDY